ncbi:E3 ubiquitin-protein ligase Siah1-like [Centruroides vittatus]|uniref:E3 ubiquitin-protein ligase Siah1-like n=1 Tax=Centruroides vittatus TaxID=120091 RepID=UPI00350FF0C0
MEGQESTECREVSGVTQAIPPSSSTDPALMTLFQCPVCYEYIRPPVYQCSTGHVVCAECRTRVQRCPTCRGWMRDNRNFLLDQVAEMLALPCKFRDNGCQEILALRDRRKHERRCAFRTCACPSLSSGCHWEGTHHQVIPHVVDKHPRVIHLNNHTVYMALLGLDLPQRLAWTTRTTCYRHHFIIQIIKTETEDDFYLLHLLVRLVGHRDEATHFKGRIEVNGRGKTLIWESIPRDVAGDINQITKNGDCMTIRAPTVKQLLVNRILSMAVFIRPTQTERNSLTVNQEEEDI